MQELVLPGHKILKAYHKNPYLCRTTSFLFETVSRKMKDQIYAAISRYHSIPAFHSVVISIIFHPPILMSWSITAAAAIALLIHYSRGCSTPYYAPSATAASYTMYDLRYNFFAMRYVVPFALLLGGGLSLASDPLKSVGSASGVTNVWVEKFEIILAVWAHTKYDTATTDNGVSG